MSVAYEFFLACDFADEVAAWFLDELRWPVGLREQQSDRVTLPAGSSEYSLLSAQNVGSRMPGAETVSLRRVYAYNRPAATGGAPVYQWKLLIRVHEIDDGIEPGMEIVPWLAERTITEGWIGYLRSEYDLNGPGLYFYASAGKAYAGAPGAPPRPWDPSAPPYALSYP